MTKCSLPASLSDVNREPAERSSSHFLGLSFLRCRKRVCVGTVSHSLSLLLRVCVCVFLSVREIIGFGTRDPQTKQKRLAAARNGRAALKRKRKEHEKETRQIHHCSSNCFNTGSKHLSLVPSAMRSLNESGRD